MKKFIVLMVVLVTMLGTLNAFPRGGYRSSYRGDSYHFVYGTVGAGYTSLIKNVSELSATGGAAAHFGLGYEFRNSGFWLSLGGQLQYRQFATDLHDYQYHRDGTDTEGMNATFHFLINQHDAHNTLLVGLPLMVGYYKNGFYFGLGGKLDYAVNASVRTSGQYTMSATYDRYVGEWQNMPSYYLGMYAIPNHKTNLKLRPYGSVIGEIGYDVLSMMPTRSRTCQVLKVGFYFEVGVTPMFENSTENNAHILAPSGGDAVYNFVVNSYLPNGLKDGDRALPYYLGVKLTYMIGGSRTGGTGTFHRGCQCYD